MMSILRTRSSRYALNDLHDARVPVFALHGSWDLAVPHRTAVDAVKRTDGTLVTVDRAGHSWILRDPETLPAIIAELLATELGAGIRATLRDAGLRKKQPTIADIEAVCYRPGRGCSTWPPPIPVARSWGVTAAPSTGGGWSARRPDW